MRLLSTMKMQFYKFLKISSFPDRRRSPFPAKNFLKNFVENSSQKRKNELLYKGKTQRGQLTQLVECLRHMEEVRGSSPLLPTRRKFDEPR